MLERFTATDGEPWRIERMDLASAVLDGLKPIDLPRLHQVLSAFPRQWSVARRLWGIRPVIPRADADPDDLKVHTPDAIQKQLGIASRQQWNAELAAIQGIWAQANLTADTSAAKAVAAVEKEEQKKREESFTGELSLEGDPEVNELLEEHGFTTDWKTQREFKWFARRLKELAPLLRQKGTGATARELILVELRLRRTQNEELKHTDSTTAAYESLIRTQETLRSRLEKLTNQLTKLAPAFFNASGEMNLQGALAEIVIAYQREGEGSGAELRAVSEQTGVVLAPARERLDGVFTVEQMQQLHRMTVQQPGQIPYRVSLVTYLMAARAGVFKKDWTMTPGTTEGARAESQRELNRLLRRMDLGYAAAYLELAKEDGVEPTDLLKDGVIGEYPEIISPKLEGLDGAKP
jgi:hypothetical protein